MGALRVVLTIVFVLICVAISVIVLMQEGKSGGLGALSGSNDTYWSRNKGRSLEDKLGKATAILGALFMVLALVLDLNIF